MSTIYSIIAHAAYTTHAAYTAYNMKRYWFYTTATNGSSQKLKSTKHAETLIKTNLLCGSEKTKNESDFRLAGKRAKTLQKSLFLHFWSWPMNAFLEQSPRVNEGNHGGNHENLWENSTFVVFRGAANRAPQKLAGVISGSFVSVKNSWEKLCFAFAAAC